jgi:hypothetical protein
LSRIVNNSNMAAVRHTLQVHHMHQQQVIQQNMRNQRNLLLQVVQEVVEVGPTSDDLQRFIDIVSREVDDPGLEYAHVETQIREHTPFAGVLQFLSSSQNRMELATYLGLLLVIFQTLLMLSQKPIAAPTAGQVEEIVERVVERAIEHVDPEAEQPEPPPTTAAPGSKKNPPERKGKR